MAKQQINIGAAANDGTGDPLRNAMDKTKDNIKKKKKLYGNRTSKSVSGDASVSSGSLTIANDSVNYEKIDAEFTTSTSLAAGTTVDIDFDSAQVFTLTPNANTTFNITNPKIGITKTIIVTGAGSTYTADTWTVGGASGTFNKISGTYDDTSSTKNFYQITCVSATEFWYSISQISS